MIAKRSGSKRLKLFFGHFFSLEIHIFTSICCEMNQNGMAKRGNGELVQMQ